MKNTLNNKRIVIPLAIAFILSILSQFYISVELVNSIFMLLIFPLLVYAEREACSKMDYVVVFVGMYLIFMAKYVNFLGNHFLGYVGVAIMILSASVIRSAALFADSRSVKVCKSPLCTLIFPAIFSVGELLVDRILLKNLLDPVANLYSFPIVLQTAYYIEPHILDFILFWFISLLVYIIQHQKYCVACACVCLALVAVVLVPGYVRLHEFHETQIVPDTSIRTAFITSEDVPLFNEVGMSLPETIETLDNVIMNADTLEVDLVMCVEEHLVVYNEDIEETLSKYAAMAKAHNVAIVLTLEVRNGPDEKEDNMVFFIDADGNLAARYKKNALVPLIETFDFNRGDGKLPKFKGRIGNRIYNMAMLICLDGNDFALTNQIDDDTELLLNPAWEWDVINFEQPRNNRINAVRHNLTNIKCTQDGFHIVYDKWGRDIVKIDSRKRFNQVDIVDVPIYF